MNTGRGLDALMNYLFSPAGKLAAPVHGRSEQGD